jgi:colicin import membrane protein
MNTQLSTIVEQSGLERAKAESIWSNFEPYFNAASECGAKVNGLEITDINQKKEMRLARDTRLELKKIRVAAEKTKKELKDGVLKEGRFIDATFNLISDATKPIEAYLKEKEEFAKRKEEERKERLRIERWDKLRPFDVVAISNVEFLNMANMTDKEFEQLLDRSQRAYEERARIEAENARLRAEAEERERQLAEERANFEAARKAAEDIVRIEREKREIAERAEREAREAAERAEREKEWTAIQKAREEAEAAQRELREKQEAEERAKREEAARLEAQRKAEEEEKRRLEAAGDKEKLSAYFDQVLSVEVPTMKSNEATGILALMHNCIQVCVLKIEKL